MNSTAKSRHTGPRRYGPKGIESNVVREAYEKNGRNVHATAKSLGVATMTIRYHLAGLKEATAIKRTELHAPKFLTVAQIQALQTAAAKQGKSWGELVLMAIDNVARDEKGQS